MKLELEHKGQIKFLGVIIKLLYSIITVIVLCHNQIAGLILWGLYLIGLLAFDIAKLKYNGKSVENYLIPDIDKESIFDFILDSGTIQGLKIFVVIVILIINIISLCARINLMDVIWLILVLSTLYHMFIQYKKKKQDEYKYRYR